MGLNSSRISPDNLQKTNDAMHQHFSTINQWQTRVKELKETQANEIAKCNEANENLQEQLRLKTLENENLHIALLERDEINQKMKINMARLKEGEWTKHFTASGNFADLLKFFVEHEEKTVQFNMNLAYAAGENKDLVQEISAKNAVIENMTKMIERLEAQNVSDSDTAIREVTNPFNFLIIHTRIK